MNEVTSTISKRIELQRSIVQGLKANLDTTEGKLVIVLEKQLDYLLQKLTRCALDTEEMKTVKAIGDMLVQMRKLTLQNPSDETLTINTKLDMAKLKALAK